LNAIEAMTRSGKIWIRTSLATEDNADFVRVEICDEGRGMDDAVCARALEPLFSTKSTVGVGMGLTIAYGIVQNLGGTLTIESKHDKGTTVAVTVPVADPELITASSNYRKQDKKTEQQGKAYKILVADDEESVRNLLARSLKNMGHEVVGAGNGVEALRIAQDQKFDLAFVDWFMPNMNGLELMQKLQETYPGMPVVMVTGWSDRENMESLAASGIDNVITKPFDMESLGEAIEQLV
ncbi:MAG: response regulator, partial [Deltaproteobacteria bacterium]|nr:response regulator [Deltaproteobacteria bacterium]